MKKRTASIVCILVVLFSTAYFTVESSGSGTSQVSFLDVGQGDSILVQDPSGFDVLIDGGPTAAGDDVVDYIRKHTDSVVEVIIISHPHLDHIGGLTAVLQASDITVGEILYSGYDGTTQAWADLVSLAAVKSIPMNIVQFPTELTWGQMDAYILNPEPGLTNPDTNDSSIVARIDYNDSSFLFTGDISDAVESTVVARETPVAADVLKVGHHGSSSSSSSAFLQAVDPTGAVIEVGADNTYGHPAGDTLSRLSNEGIRVWRTDQDGTVVLTSDGMTVTFPAEDIIYTVFLPAVIRLPTPTPTFTLVPTATATLFATATNTPIPSPTIKPTNTQVPQPPSGANVVCNLNGAAQICAWVSNGTPARYTDVTVYGRLLIANAGQSGQAMNTTWYYKTTTSYCSGTTDGNGNAACTRYISGASSGYRVNIDVVIGGYSARTWFTPQ